MSARDAEDRPREAFTIDRAYLREQAHDAVRTFFAPLAPVFAAFRADPSERRDEIVGRR